MDRQQNRRVLVYALSPSTNLPRYLDRFPDRPQQVRRGGSGARIDIQVSPPSGQDTPAELFFSPLYLKRQPSLDYRCSVVISYALH